jgi:hypothetical protein
LVHVAFSRKIWRTKHQLGKYAAYGPDVNSCAVIPTSEEKFWGSVPPSDDLAGHFVPWIGKVPRKTKVSQLELTVGGDEQIVRF